MAAQTIRNAREEDTIHLTIQRLRKRISFNPSLEGFKHINGQTTYDNGQREQWFVSRRIQPETFNLFIVRRIECHLFATSHIIVLECKQVETLEPYVIHIQTWMYSDAKVSISVKGRSLSISDDNPGETILSCTLTERPKSWVIKLRKASEMIQRHIDKIYNIDDPVGVYYVISKLMGCMNVDDFDTYMSNRYQPGDINYREKAEYLAKFDVDKKAAKHVNPGESLGFGIMKCILGMNEKIAILLWKELSKEEKNVYRWLYYFPTKHSSLEELREYRKLFIDITKNDF